MIKDITLRNKLHQLQSSFDFQTLTTCAFLVQPHSSKKRFFRSEVFETSSKQSNENEHLNYQKLVNKKYEPKKFKKFMKIFLGIDNIILEEKDSFQISKELKQNPKKCYSFREENNEKHQYFEVIYEETESNKSVWNSTHITQNEQASLGPDQLISGIGQSRFESSYQSIESNHLSNLSDEQIQKIITQKMKKLDRFNEKLDKKDQKLLNLELSLTNEQIMAIINFQKRFRSFLMKKKFIKAIRMNDQFEHKKNYIQLKKSFKNYIEMTSDSRDVWMGASDLMF